MYLNSTALERNTQYSIYASSLNGGDAYLTFNTGPYPVLKTLNDLNSCSCPQNAAINLETLECSNSDFPKPEIFTSCSADKF